MITKDWEKAASLFINGKIGIIPTDTIYGISCTASNKDLVLKIYKIKSRDLKKPFIILISSVKDLSKFGIFLISNDERIISKYWPGPVSIVFDINEDRYEYLHRGTNTLAFRVPRYNKLVELLKNTGPLVSTSANITDSEPTRKINDAVKIFKNKVDFYLDVGPLNNPPSKVVRIVNGRELIIRS